MPSIKKLSQTVWHGFPLWHGFSTRVFHRLKTGATGKTGVAGSAGGTGDTGATRVDGIVPWRIVGFFIRFMVIFILLMAPWPGDSMGRPGLAKAYAPIYRSGGNALFGSFGTAGSVDLRPSSGKDPDRDTDFVLANWQTDAELAFAGSTLQGYKPTAFVVALILATPIPWRRRWRALIWGLGFVSIYAALRMGVFLADVFSAGNDLAVFTLGPIGKSVLGYLYWVTVDSFAGWLILPLPIWAFVCFRREDWETVLKKG